MSRTHFEDQLIAARREQATTISRLIGGSQDPKIAHPPRNEKTARLLGKVSARLAACDRRFVCAHLINARGPVPVCIPLWEPAPMLMCGECFPDLPPVSADTARCDFCQRSIKVKDKVAVTAVGDIESDDFPTTLIGRSCSRCQAILNSSARRPGRNEPCPCGSSLKWKRCHGSIDSKEAPSE